MCMPCGDMFDKAIGYDDELLKILLKGAEIVDNRVVEDIDEILKFNKERGE